MWWLFLIIGFVAAYILLGLIIIVCGLILGVKNRDLPCHCNECKLTFNSKANYKFCPFCGKELTYHKEFIKYFDGKFSNGREINFDK